MSPIFFCLSITNKQTRIRIANWNGVFKMAAFESHFTVVFSSPIISLTSCTVALDVPLKISISIFGPKTSWRTHPPGSGAVSRTLLIDAGAAPFILQLAGVVTPGLDRTHRFLISPKEEFWSWIMIRSPRFSSFPGAFNWKRYGWAEPGVITSP